MEAKDNPGRGRVTRNPTPHRPEKSRVRFRSYGLGVVKYRRVSAASQVPVQPGANSRRARSRAAARRGSKPHTPPRFPHRIGRTDTVAAASLHARSTIAATASSRPARAGGGGRDGLLHRRSRAGGSRYDKARRPRPETIERTAELATAAGGGVGRSGRPPGPRAGRDPGHPGGPRARRAGRTSCGPTAAPRCAPPRVAALGDHARREFGVAAQNRRDACTTQPHFAISETPRNLGRGIAALAADPDRHRWTSRSTSSGELAHEYGVTDLDGSAPDAWRYLVEVQDEGRPADVTGYRRRSPAPRRRYQSLDRTVTSAPTATVPPSRTSA